MRYQIAARYARTLMAILMIVTLPAGCTSMRPIRGANAPTAPQAYRNISPGDHLWVEMRDGRRVQFRVQRADDQAIIAENGERYPRAEILTLKQRRFSHVKTWSLVGGVGVGVVFVIAALSAIVAGDLLGSGPD